MGAITRRACVAGLGLGAASAARGQPAPVGPVLAALAEGGMVAVIRHAEAPGTGDPPGFRLGDCSTQRNLSEAGRRQAAELGRRFRAAGVLVTTVRSSRWCRALETAALAFPDTSVEPDAALDSFFARPDLGKRQTDQARRNIDRWRGRQGVLAMVTHQVNITALTGIMPADAEVVVLRPGIAGFEVLGRAFGPA